MQPSSYYSIEIKLADDVTALAPEDVSTLLVDYNRTAATSAANIIAHGLPGFANTMFNIMNGYNYTPQRLDLDAIAYPAPTDYYLRPQGAPGCNGSFPSPECSTIFEAMHRPILSLPPDVSGLQGEWTTCLPAIYGV